MFQLWKRESSFPLCTTVTVYVVVGGFLNSAETSALSVYPEPPFVMTPEKPGIVSVAVAPVPLPVVVNATFEYVPAVYPDPDAVTDTSERLNININ